MIRIFIILILFNFGFYCINSYSIGLSKSYDINKDGKNDFRTYLSQNYSLLLIDSDKNQTIDQLILTTVKKIIKLTINSIEIIHYNNDNKISIVFFRSNRKVVLSKIIINKNLLQNSVNTENLEIEDYTNDYISKPGCNDEIKWTNGIDEIKKFLDRKVLEKYAFNKCSSVQKENLIDRILKMYNSLLDGNTTKLNNCISTISNIKNLPDNILQLITLKFDQIASGVSDLSINCLNRNDELCKMSEIGSSILYPSQINICFDSKNNSSTYNFLDEVIFHEILHSKGVELTEKDVKLITTCWVNSRSSLLSYESVNKKIDDQSNNIADEISFSPAEEIQVTPPPVNLANNVKLNEELARIEPKRGGIVPSNSAIDVLANETINWSNEVFNRVVPPAVASQNFKNNDSINFAFKKIGYKVSNPYGGSTNTNPFLLKNGNNRPNLNLSSSAIGNGTIGDNGRGGKLAKDNNEPNQEILANNGGNARGDVKENNPNSFGERAPTSDNSRSKIPKTVVKADPTKSQNEGNVGLANANSGGKSPTKIATNNGISGNPNSNSVAEAQGNNSSNDDFYYFLSEKPSVEVVGESMSGVRLRALAKVGIYVEFMYHGKKISNKNSFNGNKPKHVFVEKKGRLIEIKYDEIQTVLINDQG